jgi:hypothetical protein
LTVREAATERGAWVTNVPDYCVDEVSDHAVGMVLAWTRGLAVFDRDVRAGRWNPASARLRRLSERIDREVGALYAARGEKMEQRWFGTLDLLDRFLGVTLAHGVTGIPYVVITVSTALAAFDPRLEQAARGMGASLGQTLRWVVLPRIAPGIASGAIFAFIHSWDELVLVLFIASRNVFTLPRKIWDGINENLDPSMAAVAVLLIVFTVALLALDGALRARRR